MATYGVTSTAIKNKFHEFSDVPDTHIEFAIEEASRNVDDTWLEGDRILGVMYLAAHYLKVAISRSASDTGQQVQSERIGEISVTYHPIQQPTMASQSDLTTTPYGTRWLELAKFNHPAILVV
jgi:hypothetical protein